MKTRSSIFLLCSAALTSFAYGQESLTINYATEFLQVGRQSDGVSSLSGFFFELGSFGSSFTPTSSNPDLWNTNFTKADLPSSWIDEGGTLGEVSGNAVLTGSTSNLGNILGQGGYLWGYNTKTITTGTEWLLIDLDRSFPLSLPTDAPGSADWFVNLNSGSLAILGTLGATDAVPHLQTAAIPEPSTYAAMMGAGILGFVFFRRMRQRAVV